MKLAQVDKMTFEGYCCFVPRSLAQIEDISSLHYYLHHMGENIIPYYIIVILLIGSRYPRYYTNTIYHVFMEYINYFLHFLYFLYIGAQTFPNATFGWVNVKDVANAHIQAFEIPSASGRYCLVENVAHFSEVVRILRELYPTIQLPEK